MIIFSAGRFENKIVVFANSSLVITTNRVKTISMQTQTLMTQENHSQVNPLLLEEPITATDHLTKSHLHRQIVAALVDFAAGVFGVEVRARGSD